MNNCSSNQRDDIAEPPSRAPQAGLSLIEVLTAMAVLAISLMGSISSLLGMASLDDSLRFRTTAVRAAVSKMEVILAYDHDGDITNLVNWLGQPDQAIFSVDELPAPDTEDLDPAIQGMMAVGDDPECGNILLDATDDQRIRIAINVNWRSRSGEARVFRLPMTISAVVTP